MLNASWRLVPNLILLGTTLAIFSKGHAQTEVLTRSYDNSRTGANLSEKVLSPQKVRKLGLKRRFKIELSQDDQRIEAQPLYVPGLLMKDGKKHDVLFLFSMGNKAYAFDINTASNIWTTPLGPPSGRILMIPWIPIISTRPSAFSTHLSSIATRVSSISSTGLSMIRATDSSKSRRSSSRTGRFPRTVRHSRFRDQSSTMTTRRSFWIKFKSNGPRCSLRRFASRKSRPSTSCTSASRARTSRPMTQIRPTPTMAGS
jgi:hypothetical protein